MTTQTSLIDFFHVAIRVENPTKEMIAKVNDLSMRYGYIVEPNACTEDVYAYFKDQEYNPNSTFYKTWADVCGMSRLELLIDQIIHYTSTYGTDFTVSDRGYVPNENIDLQPIVDFDEYTLIKAVTPREMFDKCVNILKSGIALKNTTSEALVDYVYEFFNGCMNDTITDNKITLEEFRNMLNDIKNKEALVKLCNKCGIYPSNNIALLRYMVYLTTGDAMLIKNKSVLGLIKSNNNLNSILSIWLKLTDNDLRNLSKVFYRFKPIFLAFKNNNTSHDINKIRRYAKKYHMPLKVGFWESLFDSEKSIDEVTSKANELSAFKCVSLIQACKERMQENDNTLYLVRNQKIYLRKGYKSSKYSTTYLALIHDVLMNRLISILNEKSTKEVMIADIETEGIDAIVTIEKVQKVVKIPSEINIALPSSEKSFVGNYPYGTSYKLQKNNFIGIYWRGEWGTQDFDLALIDEYGHKIGWNASYYNQNKSVVYSGDMTYANPDAAEVLSILDESNLKAVVKVNQYRGNANSKYKFYFGQFNKATILHENMMVDPTTVKLSTMINVDQKEQCIGLISDGNITLMNVKSGNRIVSHASKIQLDIINAYAEKAKTFINAKDVFEAAGFKVVDETYQGDVDIDLVTLKKDSLISLMQ